MSGFARDYEGRQVWLVCIFHDHQFRLCILITIFKLDRGAHPTRPPQIFAIFTRELIMRLDENEFWIESHLSAMRGWLDRLHDLLADSPEAAVARDNARTQALAAVAHSLAALARR
jgi:hypothetical protein